MPSSVYLRPTAPDVRTTPPPLAAATVVGGVPEAAVEPGAGVPIVTGGGWGGSSVVGAGAAPDDGASAPSAPTPHVGIACPRARAGTARMKAARRSGPWRTRSAILSRGIHPARHIGVDLVVRGGLLEGIEPRRGLERREHARVALHR